MFACVGRARDGAVQCKVGDFEGSVKYIVMDEERGFNVAGGGRGGEERFVGIL